ncbi:MAG: MnhB domain-containing protein [Silanimonas lenta]
MKRQSVLLVQATRLLHPVILLASVWLLLRGHNNPGGGFIGGMVAVTATSLVAITRGGETALRGLPLPPLRFACLGVLLSLLSGVPALLLGEPYMTHLWGDLLGVKLSTVLLFDIGVYFAVWGGLGAICAKALGLEEETA